MVRGAGGKQSHGNHHQEAEREDAGAQLHFSCGDPSLRDGVVHT